MLSFLPLDVIQIIASLDKNVWFKLYLYNNEFKKLAKTPVLINLYQTKFITEYINLNNQKCTTLFGKLHSVNDQPAFIYSDGSQAWHQNGLLHRDHDLPAKIYADGAQIWYQYGQLHRDHDKPAVIYADGYQDWYQNGLRHRDHDQPAVIWADGRQAWFQYGKRTK